MPDAEPSSTAHSYEVLGKLADGGVTEIFLARAKGVGAVERVVVLKRLKRAVTSNVGQVKLFLDEAQRASQLQHPNIAQVFEVGKLGGSYFFAMEFVNGETLQSLMLHARSRKIQVPVRAVLTIAAAMAAGLHHAHDRNGTDGKALGIVHGDVSPTNTLVSQEGIVKLVDFGVGRAGERGASKVTPYSSPEQCRGDALDRRSDLFSLGIVLWELLTLDPLYQRASDADIRTAIESEEPAKPSAKRYDVPPELDAMVLRLLAKNPLERFQDADELLASIEALAQKLSILLSTADLSRMMRLWFGTKSEPAIDPSQPDAPQPVLVSSEQIPDDLAIPVQSPIDDQLDSVRSAAALIAVRATERSRSPTGRPNDKPTVPPELMDNPNENFEQIRDRILARARQKKETRNPIVGAIPGATGTGTTPPPLGTGTPIPGPAPAGLPGLPSPAPAPTAVPSGAAIASIKPIQVPASAARDGDRHNRTTAQAPLSVIEDSLRKSGKAEPVETKSNGANGTNGHAAEDAVSGEMGGTTVADVPDTEPMQPMTDKVVIDNDEIRGSRTASGELGAKAAAAVAAAAGNAAAAHEPSVQASDAEPARDSEDDEHRAKTRTGDEDDEREDTGDDDEDADDRREAPSGARDVARRSDPEREQATERMSYAALKKQTATAHDEGEVSEDTLVPPGRPTWLVPVLGAAALLMVVLVVVKLVSGGKPAAAKQHDQVASTNNGVPTSSGAPTPAEKAAADKAAADKAAADKAAADKAAADKAAADKAAADKVAADKAAADKAAADQAAVDKVAADKLAADKAAADKAAADKAAADKAAADKAAADKAAADKAAADKAAKAAADKAARDAESAAWDKAHPRKEPTEKKEPEAKKGIEEAFAAGDFAGTNTACTKEIVFTPEKLVMCAQAACQTKNTALAKRWINAISKSQRPELIEKCKSLGVELESPPPAP